MQTKPRKHDALLFTEVILPFIITRLLLLLIGIVTIIYIEPLINQHQPIRLDQLQTSWPTMLGTMWVRFDSGFYLDIAMHGYQNAASLHGMSNWAFFPLYPLLIHLLAWPFPFSEYSYIWIGIIISNISVLVALAYLYKLTIQELDSRVAGRAVLYLLLFPLSFYLSAVYPESLFLALVISCLYYARMRRWWLAGFLGGLAALTRPQGLLMFIVIGWEYWRYLRFDRNSPLECWRMLFNFVALLQIPLGLGLFCLYARWKVGTFFAFQMAERYGWHRTLRDPFRILIDAFTHPFPAGPYEWNFYGLNMLVIVLFFLALIPIFRRLPSRYGIFSLLFLLMPLASGGTSSIARYYMEIFPFFIVLSCWSCNIQKEWRHNLIITTFAILLAFGLVLWTLGVYAIA